MKICDQISRAAKFLALCLLIACGPKSEPEDQGEHSPAHVHTAPRGGALVALGEEAANIEFVLDSAQGKLTAYILDGHAENPIRIPQPEISLEIRFENSDQPLLVMLKAVGSELTGESPGDTSQFEAADPALQGRTRFQVAIGDISVQGVRHEGVRFSFPEGKP